MALLITLVVTSLAVYAVRVPLQRVPVVFYLLACVVCAAGVYLTLVPPQDPLIRSITAYLQKGNIPFALFAIVMFAGIFKEGSRLRLILRPLRGELSILAGILICGHIIPYLYNYASSFTSLASIKTLVLVSLGISALLVILLIPLFFTSLRRVKKKMRAETWRRVQLLAYPFFILIYLHILGFLLPLALRGNVVESINLAVYTLVFVSYFALRLKAASYKKNVEQTQTGQEVR